METGISGIRFTGKQSIQHQEQSLNDTHKPDNNESSKVMESSVLKLIRMLGLGKNLDIEI